MKKNFGIAFVTGRSSFQNVLRTYFNNWIEHDLIADKNVGLHLFVVYDVNYSGAARSDFRNIPREITALLESVSFYGRGEIEAEKQRLIGSGLVNAAEADLVFGGEYAGLRNAALHFANQRKMDRLLFLDDDEYPLAVVRKNNGKLCWFGQSVVRTHLKYSEDADITNGLHCGYISPLPHIDLGGSLHVDDFRKFIEAISNDILSWESVKRTTIQNFGITYADERIGSEEMVTEVAEINRTKFISGANLCLNLERMKQPPVFYNPPGARGEDAFMSTTLTSKKVVRVPCYTFHDAFSIYSHLLNGVLPQKLVPVDARSPVVLNRFVKAAIGWVRYKPLLTYITQPDRYEAVIENAIEKLERTVPKFCEYFGTRQFEAIGPEFRRYHANVVRHFESFEATKRAWLKLTTGWPQRSVPSTCGRTVRFLPQKLSTKPGSTTW
jgi:hypothetical protein